MKSHLNILLATLLHLTTAHGAVEAEPNNSSPQANGISVGVTMQGQLASESDEDWFALWVPQATTLRLAFDSPSNLPSPSWEYHVIRCQDSGGNVLLRFGAAEDKSFDFFLPAGGVYHFVIQKGSYSLQTGQYSILLSEVFTTTERELNNTRPTASPVQQGIQTAGQISSDSDTDWFSFTAGSSGTATVAFDSPANLPSPSWEYHVIQVTNGGGFVYSSVRTASDTQFNVALPAAGTYYVGVTKGSDSLLTDQYNLNLISIPSPPTATELTATIQTAIDLKWISRDDRSYKIERSTTMEPGTWSLIVGPIPGTGIEMRYFDSTSGNNRAFYRVVEQ